MLKQVFGAELKAAQFVSRHFVALAYFGRPRVAAGEPEYPWQQVCASCFVMSFGEHWFLVTAGHVIEDIIKEQKDARKEVRPGFELIDCFGPEARHEPFPFPVDLEADAMTIDDRQRGIDLGMIYLRPHYKRLLEANGVVPVNESSWNGRDWGSHDFYLLVGVPRSLIETEVVESRVAANIGLAWLRVERLKRRPKEIDPTRYKRFFGRLPGDEPKDIVGMSGCPILGFTRTAEGLKYWVVAIQSLWHEPTRKVAACPLQVFGPRVGVLVEAWFRQHADAENLDQ